MGGRWRADPWRETAEKDRAALATACGTASVARWFGYPVGEGSTTDDTAYRPPDHHRDRFTSVIGSA